MAENNDPSGMSFEDFVNGTNQPAPEEPQRKVIPPKKTAVSEDPLAEAFMGHGVITLMLAAVNGGGEPEALHKLLEEMALDAAARFRGRVIAGEVSL